MQLQLTTYRTCGVFSHLTTLLRLLIKPSTETENSEIASISGECPEIFIVQQEPHKFSIVFFCMKTMKSNQIIEIKTTKEEHEK